MPRLYLQSIDRPAGGEGRIILTAESARYLRTVLRAGVGDRFECFDAKGARFTAEVLTLDRKEVVAVLVRELPPLAEPARPVVLVQGLLKGAKMDLVVQKAVELGAHRIVPAICERSQLRSTRKTERWRKIAAEAARQSGRTHVPGVGEPAAFEQCLAGGGASLKGLIFWEEGGQGLKEAMPGPGSGEIIVAIGPEGGFSSAEVGLAESRGLVAATLGPRILRAETASLAALALVQFLLGEI